MNPRIVNKLPRFQRVLFNVYDDALKEAARDTLIKARNRAPFQKGQLRAQSNFRSVRPLLQRVSFGIEYARFQEFGGDRRRRVRRYSTAGTGAHYLKNAGDAQSKVLGGIFKKHSTRARV